ncbi:MAG: hypothetical protein CFE40_13250 [Burkholderiales bacterium PBB1]|nr:MAG: hypothetical protein CFE40_13250 [Burkholderiales bacterium PBB1]
MISVIRRLGEKGPRGVLRAIGQRVARPLHLLRTSGAADYRSPTAAELQQIERGVRELGMPCSVYDEKLLEHFVAWGLLDLDASVQRWPYLDIASASSPWVRMLRDQGLTTLSIDLAPDPSVASLPYYLRGDATAMPFHDASIGSASLQCAYEMFAGDADIRLLRELARVLRSGGRVVVSPLYMHVQACYYQSPEHHGKPAGDAGAVRYLRRDAWDVRASRKYSPGTLMQRVWRPATQAGLIPQLRVLRNPDELGRGIYLHFVLVLDKPATGVAENT